jgi:Cu2+-exporting ATPase
VPAPDGVDCFHCSLPVPVGSTFGAQIGGAWQRMCCPGCEAVAQTIAGCGLDDYYRLREAAAPARDGVPRTAVSDNSTELPEDMTVYDTPEMQARFVREVVAAGADSSPSLPRFEHQTGATPSLCDAELLLEGVRCTACVWLIEQTLVRVPGVEKVDINYANRRARVRWNPVVSPFSRVLSAVRSIGYKAWPFEASRLALIERSERSAALWRLFVAGFGMMQVMMYAFPVYIADPGTMTGDIEQLMRWAGLILTVPVMLYSAQPFFAGAWRDLRGRQLGMDVPVALGIAVAFLASVWATLDGQGAVYFDSVAMFVFLLLGGRYLELLARQRAGRSLQHLGRLVPETAHRLDEAGSLAFENVPVSRLRAGDRVLVQCGESIPADGVLESPAATVSEALLTGESRPLNRVAGDEMVGGAANAGNPFTMRVTRVGGDTALSAIVRLMERAMSERPRWVDMSQRAAGMFVAGILVCAALAALLWFRIDPSRAMWIAVSVMIVTCPCALSLALPVALTVATGEMARRGVVPTRGHAIGSLAGVTDVVFDKTGTLTLGRLGLSEILTFSHRDAAASLRLAAALGRLSAHPVARALVAAVDELQPIPEGLAREESGMGVEATIGGVRYRLGRSKFVGALHRQEVPVAWLHSSESTTWLGDEKGWIAAFRFGDELRAGSREAIASLREMGRRIHLLSGDSPATVKAIAAQLGIEAVSAGATPAEKLAYVQALQRAGARVAMVGDGVNDAPVLAQADVSIALRGGANLAQVQADAVLLSDDPRDLADAMRLARRTRAVAKENLAWALAYNVVVIPLAFAGLVTPLIAGIGMSGSSLLVVLNALRLRIRNRPQGESA